MTKPAPTSHDETPVSATAATMLTPELKAASSFTAQLLALDVGGIAIKGHKIGEQSRLNDIQTNAAEERKRLRNSIWASIKAAQVREQGAYAARKFEVECFHAFTPDGKVIVQAVVERTA